MTTFVKKWLILIAVFNILLIVITTNAYSELLIVANPSLDIKTLSQRNAKKIFLGELPIWNNGLKVTVAVHTSSEVYKQFTKQVCQKSTFQFENYWRRNLFTGKSLLPRLFKTEGELIKYISQTEGAIGFVSSKKSAANLKIIEIK